MESDPTRMCELLVGLPEVNVLSVDDVAGDPLRVHIEGRSKRPGCAGCGVFAHVKDRPVVELVDLPCFGRATRLISMRLLTNKALVLLPYSRDMGNRSTSRLASLQTQALARVTY